NGLANESGNLGMFAATQHAEFHHAGHFLAEAYATRAVDAAGHFLHGDQWTRILGHDDALFFRITGSIGTVTHSQILQLAFAALIADRAIQRVINQQEFHHALLSLDGLVAMGAHDHAVGHGSGASRQGLRRLLHFDQAHTAV